MSFEKNFLGKDGFVWFVGVVEDRKDPLGNDRVRVRCHGYHTEDKSLIPTEHLPWANVIAPTTSGGVSGLGDTTELVEGSFVFGFFLDGIEAQHPVVLGTWRNIPQSLANSQKGFNDPRTDTSSFPKQISNRTENRDGTGTTLVSEASGKTYPSEVDQPDVNRLQRGVEEGTIVQDKKSNRVLSITTAGGGSFEEPETPFAQVHPFNHVRATESGHVQEFDDTPDAERIHQYHRSGTFYEVHPDGSRVLKIVNDEFKFVLKDSHEHVENKKYITVDKGMELFVNRDGESENLIIKVGEGGNFDITLDKGDMNVTVSDGNVNKYVKGNVTETIDGNFTRTVKGNVTETVEGNKTQTINGALTATLNSENITVNTTSIKNVSGTATLVSSGPLVLKGSPLLLN